MTDNIAVPENIVIGACNLLDTIKSEWGNQWSEWDQSVRDGLSVALQAGARQDLTASGGLFAKEKFEATHDASGKRIDGYGDPAKGEYNAFLGDDGSDIPCD